MEPNLESNTSGFNKTSPALGKIRISVHPSFLFYSSEAVLYLSMMRHAERREVRGAPFSFLGGNAPFGFCLFAAHSFLCWILGSFEWGSLSCHSFESRDKLRQTNDFEPPSLAPENAYPPLIFCCKISSFQNIQYLHILFHLNHTR